MPLNVCMHAAATERAFVQLPPNACMRAVALNASMRAAATERLQLPLNACMRATATERVRAMRVLVFRSLTRVAM